MLEKIRAGAAKLKPLPKLWPIPKIIFLKNRKTPGHVKSLKAVFTAFSDFVKIAKIADLRSILKRSKSTFCPEIDDLDSEIKNL